MLIRTLALFLFAASFSCSAGADPVRVASWNLFNLHSVEGVPLRSRAVARSEADYARLRRIASELAADIVGLQEVNGPRAARRVFPEAEWELHFSGRYADDVAASRKSDRIYTGFAVRRGVFDSVVKRDVSSLGLLASGEDARPLRWGVELVVERGHNALRLLVVHLKSGCHQASLEKAKRSDACRTLGRQRAPLETWIDAAAADRLPFIVLGDFNRRFDVYGPRDHLWQEIDDGVPPGLELFRFPFRSESKCWAGTRRHHREPIDFIVLDARAHALLVPESFRELNYAEADRDLKRGTPSDHCPIVLGLDF